MSRLADIYDPFAQRTGKFLLSALEGANVAAARAAGDSRHLNDVEKERMLDGFRATALVADFIKIETRRERRNMAPFFPPGMLGDMKESAARLAQQATVLEIQRDQFLLGFYRQLEERLAKSFAAGRSKRKDRASKADDFDDDGEVKHPFTGDPTPERGYSTLKRMDGSIDQIRTRARDKAIQARRATPNPMPAPQPAQQPEQPRERDHIDEFLESFYDVPAEQPAPAAQPAPQPVAAPAPKPVPKPVPQPAPMPVFAAETDQIDALWYDPKFTQDMIELWTGVGDWLKGGRKGPPPRPSFRLNGELLRNTKKNPETMQLMNWLHSQAPPDG